MAATARSIIQDALLEIGAYDPNETMSDSNAQTGLLRLQNLIDAWGADRLTIAINTRVAYTLTSGTNTVTIGPTGNIVTARPVWITEINYLVPGSSPSVEVPLAPLDDNSYAELSIKSLSSSLPTQFYYNATTTNGTLFFWPTVTQNVDLALYLPQPVGIPADLNSSLLGPPGYQEAFMYQLALRLCTPFQRPVPTALPGLAQVAYDRMKRPNVEPGLLGMDQALVPRGGSGYNVLTDQHASSSGR